MNILVILAHPNKKSFNHAIAARAVEVLQGLHHRIVFHDLYTEGFDPLLPTSEIDKNGPVDKVIQQHCKEIKEAGGMIFIHPNWWGQPPAILTGWLDRVLRPGVAYRFNDGDSGEGIAEGLLSGKIALVINTSDTPEEREKNFFGDPLDKIWKTCIFQFCGISDYHRKVFNIVVTSTEEERKNWLSEVEKIIYSRFSQK